VVLVKARDKIDNKIYALKKVRMDLDSDGFPVTSVREIKILRELNHTNIIKLKEVVVGYKQDR
jgi:serine/threonine protein kinase